VTDKHEIVARSLLWCEAMTLTVLPHIALVAGHRVGAVVKIVSMHTTSSAVEVPFVIVFLSLLEISLKLFLLRPDLSFRLAFRALCALVLVVLRRSALALSF
jgi:hypothetical protein